MQKNFKIHGITKWKQNELFVKKGVFLKKLFMDKYFTLILQWEVLSLWHLQNNAKDLNWWTFVRWKGNVIEENEEGFAFRIEKNTESLIALL